jgi:hypothetical protein
MAYRASGERCGVVVDINETSILRLIECRPELREAERFDRSTGSRMCRYLEDRSVWL